MADLQRIQFKRSNTAGSAPAPAVLSEGELALNLKDRCIYSKDSGGNIVNLSNPVKHDGDQVRTGQMTLRTAYAATSQNAQIFHDVRGGAAGKPATIRSMREDPSSNWVWEQVVSGKLIYSTGINPSTATKKVALNAESGEIVTYGNNGIRVVGNKFGAIFRNDGDAMCILATNANNQEGDYNSLRPLQINMTNGVVSMAHGAVISQNLAANAIQASGSIRMYNSVAKHGFVMSANTAGYAELVHVSNPDDPNAGYEWGYGLRNYGGTDWRVGAQKLYGQHNIGQIRTDVGISTRFWGASDYADGTLIETDLDASQEQGASFTVDILGKTYVENGSGVPLHIVAEGYLWANTFYSSNAKIDGPFEGTRELFFLKLPNGKLGIWFSRQGYWRNYGVTVYQTNAPTGYQYNHVTNVVNSAKPVSDKILSVPLHYTYGTYRKPTADDIVANSTINGSLTLNGTQYIDCRSRRNHLAFKVSDSEYAWLYCDPSNTMLHLSSNLKLPNGAVYAQVLAAESGTMAVYRDTSAGHRRIQLEVHPDGNMDIATHDGTSWFYPLGFTASNNIRLNGTATVGGNVNASADVTTGNGNFISYASGAANAHLWFKHAETGGERALIYATQAGQLIIRNNSGGYSRSHTFDQEMIQMTGGEVQGQDRALLRGTVQGGGWTEWQSRAAGLLIDCQNSDGSAYNVWKATHWGARHIAAMDVHWGGLGYAKLHVSGADFTFDGNGDVVIARNVNANDVYIRSDRRLKINLERFENASDKLRQLTVYTYDKLAELGSERVVGREIGIIAQDLRKIVKEAVNVSDDENQLHTISNSAVNAVLIKAVQEILDRLDAIESRI